MYKINWQQTGKESKQSVLTRRGGKESKQSVLTRRGERGGGA